MAGRIALAGLRFLASLKNFTLRVWAPVAPTVLKAFRLVGRFILLPLYRAFLLLRLRLGKLVLSARGLFFLVFANRYVLHGVVAVLCVVTIATQFQTRSATALEAGQHSLLYALVTNGRESLVEEKMRPELLQKDAHYLGSETLEAVPGVDFDYEDSLDQTLADLTVPGSIALLPGSNEPGVPGTQTCAVRTETTSYTVQSGDVIGTIAGRYCVTVGTVLWANNLTARSLIRPGSTLKIPPVSGVLHIVKKGDTLGKIALLYGTKNIEEVLAANRLSDESDLAIGEELMIPGGIPPEPPKPIAVRKPSNVRPDVPISRIGNKALDIYGELTGKTDTREKPQDELDAAGKSKLLWPTHLRIINQYYGWRHTGVDIDGDYVDPIYAAADGVVEKAGWNSGGYGLMILINHGGGTVTRYGHASKLFVKPGDTVKRGQVVAMVGTTGRSTGTHLHFEVYINNKRVNPLAYIK